MLCLVCLAASLTALHVASVLCFRMVYTAVIIVFALAVIAARYRNPFWFGFAVMGWTALLLGNGDQYYPRIGINMDWLPARWTYYAWTWLFALIEPSSSNVFQTQERLRYSARIFSLLMTLPLAVLGGIAACAIARSPNERHNGATTE
jgi:hypothetical protein